MPLNKLSPRAALGLSLICIMAGLAAATPRAADAGVAIHKVGKVTWHPARYVGHSIRLEGYVLVKEAGYVLFSDEATGKVSMHDLPVIGTGVEQMLQGEKYLLEGKFVHGGFKAMNASPYHLELSAPPQIAKP